MNMEEVETKVLERGVIENEEKIFLFAVCEIFNC